MIITLDSCKKKFVFHIVFLNIGLKILICLAQKVRIGLLLAKKVIISTKYLNFAIRFLKKLAVELCKKSEINKHTINLESNKQLLHKSVYNLELVELKIFKT